MTVIPEVPPYKQELLAEESVRPEVVLTVQQTSKKFCRSLKRSLFYGIQDIGSELTGLRNENRSLRLGEFWALKDVNFELRRGQALGLVGKNGSGKSTLLRIIAGLIKPDRGVVTVRGRVAPLIALGAGFNPVLSGRENIYTNMSILGLSKKEIDARFDEVIEFAEIGEAIDAPVQSYSSGMAARLGFASAVHTDPDILLIDEVLAVGDSRFRGKCFQKLHQLRQHGTSFILVSHNVHSILTICDSAVYLKQGKPTTIGDAASIMTQYDTDLYLNGIEYQSKPVALLKTRETVNVDILDIFFRNGQGDLIKSPITGDLTLFCIRCKVLANIGNIGFTVTIRGLSDGGEIILKFNSSLDGNLINLVPGEHEIQIQMPHLGLRLGAYFMDIHIKQDRLFHLDSIESFPFTVEERQKSSGRYLFYQPRTWSVISEF